MLIVALGLLLTSFTAEAKLVGLGLSAGSHNSNYKIKGYDAIENGSGFQVGASATIKMPILFSVTPELIYYNDSFKITNSSILGGKCKVRNKTIDMPIVFGMSLFGPLRLEAGPTFTLYNNAKGDFYGDKSGSIDLGSIESNTGYVAGLKLTLRKIVIGARYYGQFEAHKSSLGTSDIYKVKSNSYSLTFGFLL